MSTVAPAGPTVSGDLVTVNQIVNDPVYVQDVVQSLVNMRLLSKRILTGRVDVTGSGSALIETAASPFTSKSSERIADNDDYPLTDDPNPTLTPVNSDKWALATEISQVLVKRNRRDVVANKFLRLANRIAVDFDTAAMSAVATAVTQTQAAAAVWTSGSADPFLDIMNAGAIIDTLDMGWEADTVVARPAQWAQLIAQAKVLNQLPREGGGPVLTGRLVQIGGLNIWKSTRLASGVDVMVLDSRMLGGIMYEDQGGEYQGSPDDVQTLLVPRPGNDGLRLQARLVNVPYVQHAGAAVELTGVTS